MTCVEAAVAYIMKEQKIPDEIDRTCREELGDANLEPSLFTSESGVSRGSDDLTVERYLVTMCAHICLRNSNVGTMVQIVRLTLTVFEPSRRDSDRVREQLSISVTQQLLHDHSALEALQNLGLM
jgi:hypothetical protein